MALQTSCYTTQAVAVAGDLAVPEQAMYYPLNLEAASGGVEVGKWVYYGASGGLANTGSGAPLGIAQRNLSYPQYNVTSGGTLVIPAGQPVQTVVQGDVYVGPVTTSAAAGAGVWTDGSGGIAFASASGLTDTGWKLAAPVTSGGMAVIYKH
jgi:hypothetical protein